MERKSSKKVEIIVSILGVIIISTIAYGFYYLDNIYNPNAISNNTNSKNKLVGNIKTVTTASSNSNQSVSSTSKKENAEEASSKTKDNTSSSLIGNTSSTTGNNSTVKVSKEENTKVINQGNGKITLEKFNKIKTGMSYEEVKNIIGSEGTVISESSIGDSRYDTIIYMWYGDGLSGQLGSNANFTFQGGKLLSKAQIGLQ